MSEKQSIWKLFSVLFLRSKILFIQEFLSINGETHNIQTYQILTQYILPRYVHIVIVCGFVAKRDRFVKYFRYSHGWFVTVSGYAADFY